MQTNDIANAVDAFGIRSRIGAAADDGRVYLASGGTRTRVGLLADCDHTVLSGIVGDQHNVILASLGCVLMNGAVTGIMVVATCGITKIGSFFITGRETTVDDFGLGEL